MPLPVQHPEAPLYRSLPYSFENPPAQTSTHRPCQLQQACQLAPATTRCRAHQRAPRSGYSVRLPPWFRAQPCLNWAYHPYAVQPFLLELTNQQFYHSTAQNSDYRPPDAAAILHFPPYLQALSTSNLPAESQPARYRHTPLSTQSAAYIPQILPCGLLTQPPHNRRHRAIRPPYEQRLSSESSAYPPW